MDETVSAMRFGRFGREDNTLVLVTCTGTLAIKILKRTAHFENLEITSAPLIGNTGIIGNTEIIGNIGILGETGIIGNTGIIGDKGIIGHTGIIGNKEIIGNTGINYLPGRIQS